MYKQIWLGDKYDFMWSGSNRQALLNLRVVAAPISLWVFYYFRRYLFFLKIHFFKEATLQRTAKFVCHGRTNPVAPKNVILVDVAQMNQKIYIGQWKHSRDLQYSSRKTYV